MYSAQSVNQGLKAPPTALSRSTSNGLLMDYSDKAQLQQDLMDVDCSRTTNNNVGIPTGLMRYRSAPSSFFASLVEEPDDYLPRVTSPEPENVIARYFSADSSSLTTDSTCRVIQPNGSQGSAQEKQHPGEPNPLPRMNNARIKRGAAGNEDLGKHHHLPSILENGSDTVSHNSFCNSQMMYQTQDPRSGMENAYRMNPACCNPHNSCGGSLNNMSSPSTKSALIRHSSSPAGLLSRLIVDGQGVLENGERTFF